MFPLALPCPPLRLRLALLGATCIAALLLPLSALAQGATPLAGEAPREVEVKDGSVALPRGEEAPLVPPVLEADSPAAWPEGSMPDRTLRHPGSTQEDLYFQDIRDDLQLSASPFDASIDLGSAERHTSVFLDVRLPAAVRLRHVRISGIQEPGRTVGMRALAELSLFE